LVWNHSSDAAGTQPVAHRRPAVGLVTGQYPWAFSWPAQRLRNGDVIHHRIDTCRFVDLARGDFDRQRSGLAISDQVELRSKPASAAAQRVVGGFVLVPAEAFLSAPPAARAARTLAPSMHHKCQSINPLRSSLICSASTMRANTPSRR